MTVADQRLSALNVNRRQQDVIGHALRNDLEPDRRSVIIELVERNTRLTGKVYERCGKKSESKNK
jgi:hypothetical protein